MMRLVPRDHHLPLAVLIGLACFGVYGSVASAAADEVAQLVAVLRSDASYMEKLRACKRLRQLGAAEAVPALGELLLADENLSHAARIALEAIPDPAAGKVLVDALGRLEGRRRLGVIQSLGVRREIAAVPLLIPLLNDVDDETAVAAAAALGKIATPEATAALTAMLKDTPAPRRAAAGSALLQAAEILQAQGKTDTALTLNELVARSPVPKHIGLAAKRACILVDKQNWSRRLGELLRGDPAEFATGLEVARLLPAAEVAALVATSVHELEPDRQALAVELLGDLGVAAALPTVVQCAKSADLRVKTAAVRTLGKLGDATVFSLLLELASRGEPPLAELARQSLALLPDPAVNEKIIAALKSADPKAEGSDLLVLVELAGRRRITQAAELVRQLVDSPHRQLRHAAIATLGQVIEPAQLEVLTTRLLHPQEPEDRPVIEEAIRLATIRTPEREVAAQALARSLAEAPADLHPFLIEVLGLTATSTALNVMRQRVWQPTYQDQITRILGQWMTPEAAPVLLEVAEKIDDPRFRVRALRGYLRIARQFDVPPAERLWMYAQGLRLADRDEERQLVLEGLLRLAKTQGVKPPDPAEASLTTVDQAVRVALLVAQNLSAHQPAQVRQAVLVLGETTQNPQLRAQAQALAGKLKSTKP